jgi:hypothetical protein
MCMMSIRSKHLRQLYGINPYSLFQETLVPYAAARFLFRQLFGVAPALAGQVAPSAVYLVFTLPVNSHYTFFVTSFLFPSRSPWTELNASIMMFIELGSLDHHASISGRDFSRQGLYYFDILVIESITNVHEHLPASL